MNETYRHQLMAKMNAGEYNEDDAIEIILWLNKRKRGYK